MIRRGIVLLICAALAAQAAEDRPARKGGSRQPLQASTCNDVPAHPLDLILGRPTSNSITVSALCYADAEGCIAYGTARGSLSVRTPVRSFKSGEPALVVLSALQPNTQYFYQFRSSRTNSAELTFHTARPPGSAFTFTVTADLHLDERTDPLIYQRTLANARADVPDFHLDLGDTFMTEKHPNREAAARQYLAQRYYFGQLCESAPLFLVLGKLEPTAVGCYEVKERLHGASPVNHDGESPRWRGADADGLAVWSNLMRKRYFPNPVPDSFYTGDAMQYPGAGLLQDYMRTILLSIVGFALLSGTCVGQETKGAGKAEASKATAHSGGLHGYIGFSASRPPVRSEFSAGMGFYSAVWLLIDQPLANFQIGLAGAWITPNNSDNKDKPLAPEGTLARNWPERGPTWSSVFQTVEGGLGYWAGNHFRYGPPKFSMNATPQCYDYEVGSPGWSFFYSNEALPDNRLGIAQLSNRRLIPPDALPFHGNPNGQFLGYSWMALPFTDPTAGDPPTGDQSWTCFLSAANFKGPIAY